MSALAGKTALVTGATGGIGHETALGLARLGARLLLHGRTRESVVDATTRLKAACPAADVIPLTADFADLSQVRQLAANISAATPVLDMLVNNAGCWTASRSLTRDGFETQFGVNHLAPFLLTRLVLPCLQASEAGRIVMVSSTMHHRAELDFDDLMQAHGRYNGIRAYANSKLCNLLMMQSLMTDLQGTSVLVNALHPGAVATDIARTSGALGFLMRLGRPLLLSPAQGALTSLYLSADPGVTTTGGYYTDAKLAAMHPNAKNPALADRLQRVSAALTGV